MVPFLKQVASYYYDEGRIDQRCFVFPNRRSAVFFRKYVGDVLREAPSGLLQIAIGKDGIGTVKL